MKTPKILTKNLLVLLCFLLNSLHSSNAICAARCSCYLDIKGRNTVECREGGMVGPLTLEDVSTATEVLKITAPEDNMNLLTMSPVLQNYRKLEEIHITRSNVPILGMHFFFGLVKLDILNLSQNNITQPLDHNFRGLFNLKELCLDDNRIYSLPSGTFRYLKELRVLSIQRNRIRELMPRTFQELDKLKVLKLSGNNLGDLNAEVFNDIKELRTLECRGCNLERVTSHLYDVLPHLTHLDLGDNHIKTLAPDEFQALSNLRSLRLDGNHITIIQDNTFRYQPELKKLILSRNKMRTIQPNAFINLFNLTDLDVSHNHLDNLDGSLFETIGPTLIRLSLSGNVIPMRDIESILKKCSALRELYLSDMNLATISANLVPKTVSILSLSGNYISYLPSESLPENLIELDLGNNKFRGLDEETMEDIEHIPKLRLEQNPWSCDLCHIIPLLNRINKSSNYFNIKCYAPYSMENQILGHIQREDLSWCSATSYNTGDPNFFLTGDEGKLGVIAAGASAILFILTIVAILGALCYSRRHAAKYYTHEEKRAPERESIFETHSPLFSEERELSFKFPLDLPEKKVSIATIDEIKKDHAISNGT